MLPFTARLGHPFCIPSGHREPHCGLGSAGFRSPLCRERPCAGSTARSRSRPVPVPAPVPLPGPFPFPFRLPFPFPTRSRSRRGCRPSPAQQRPLQHGPALPQGSPGARLPLYRDPAASSGKFGAAVRGVGVLAAPLLPSERVALGAVKTPCALSCSAGEEQRIYVRSESPSLSADDASPSPPAPRGSRSDKYY